MDAGCLSFAAISAARSFTLTALFVGSLFLSGVLKMLQLSSSSAVTFSRGSCKLLNIRLGGLLPCSEAGEAGEAAEVDDLIIDHGCAACHWSTGVLPVLPVGLCWQLQDVSD